VVFRAKQYFVETGMIVFITLSQKNLFGKILELIFQNSFGQQAVDIKQKRETGLESLILTTQITHYFYLHTLKSDYSLGQEEP